MEGNDTFATGYAVGRDSNNNGNSGMWGGDWAWWIVILLIFGWGNNGFGGFGNGGAGMNGALTRGELCQDMNFNDLQSAVRGISQGICDSTFALNNTMTNGFAGVQQTLCQGFGGVNTALMQQGYETRNAINGVSAQLASCCCDLSRGQERLACDIERSSNAIVQAGNANTQRILDFLCNEKISSLQSENAALTAQLSQNSQTQTIINTLMPVARPAYITCSPYESAFGRGGYGYGNNCGCGNGCGCGC